MKENKDKIDLFFNKAFAGFEESPPAAVKSAVFKRILLFSTWQMIRKYVVVFVILLMVGGIVYFSGAFSPVKSDQLALQSRSVQKQQNTIKIIQTNRFVNMDVTPTDDPNETKLLLDKSEDEPYLKQQEQAFNNKQKIYTYKNDKTNTSQISSSISNLAKESVTNYSAFITEKSSVIQTNKVIFQNNITTVKTLNSIDGFLTDPADNIILSPIDNASKSNINIPPLLWSVGFNLGQSLVQSGIIKPSEQVSDDNITIDSKLNFPSGFAGLNVRAEKKHLYFDFGLQYTHFSEKISTNQLLYNSQEYQNIAFLGQNTVIDTNGSYWHYFYISDSTIRIIDSVHTWRVDTNQISMYDTTIAKRYDTLQNPSWKNSYYFFEIPLNIGWMQNFGRVNLGISTGPIFSFLIGTKGKIPYHAIDQAKLIAIKQEFQPFRFGISWQISGLINYQFSNRMVLELSPYYRHTLLPFTSSVTSATLKHSSFGVQLGIRYFF